ncbi:MAG: LysR family transcriptional regulator [Pseudomonadota bacterium]
MDWDKLRIFHVVAQAGSFTHGGEALGLSQSAISRQISGLEESIDVKLFHRHARGLILTEQGELLAKAARDIFAKLSMIENQLADTKALPSGPLRITVPEFIGSTWLCPQVKQIKERYPDLEISVILDDRILNLSMSEADAAIRLHKPDQPDLTAIHLTDIHFHICGSREYLKKNGTPKSVKDLKNHTLIGYPGGGPTPFIEPNWLFKKAGVDMDNNPNLIRMNSLYSIYETVGSGAGLASLPDYLIARDNNIDICLPTVERPPVKMYFVYPEERKGSSRIEVLRDFLTTNIPKTKF